MAVTKTCN